MKSFDRAFLVTYIVVLFDVLWAQSTHIITVGDTGSFYVPQAIIANTGDLVTFKWTGNVHSVTQSSFDNPCFPMTGGFDSGFTGNPPGMLILPEWNLTITDDTVPIYFFCKATVPAPHCINGMVGSINVPISGTNTSFGNFTLKAKAIVNPPPLPSSTPVLTGIGAMATSAPVPTMNQTNATITTADASSPTNISSTTSTAAQSSTPATVSPHSGLSSGGIGGIVGGVVGGIILIILVGLLFISFQRGRKYRREAKASRVLSRPDPMMYAVGLDRTEPTIDIHRSQPSLSMNDSLENSTSVGQSINVKELAAEIAKNIRQEGGGGQPYKGQVLPMVPEQQFGIPYAESGSAAPTLTASDNRSAGSSRTQPDGSRVHGGRQLPRPPPSAMNHRQPADTHSVDTLPAYRYPQ